MVQYTFSVKESFGYSGQFFGPAMISLQCEIICVLLVCINKYLLIYFDIIDITE